MKKEEIWRREKELTDQFFDQLEKAGHNMARTPKEESGSYDIVTLEFDGIGIGGDYVLAHCHFLPTPEDDMPVDNFRVNLTIIDSVETKEKKADMMQAMSYVNYLLPIGAFVLDPELNVMTYRRNTAIPVTMDPEETLGLMGRELFNSLAMISPFIAPLVTLRNAEISLDQFVDAVTLVFNLQVRK